MIVKLTGEHNLKLDIRKDHAAIAKQAAREIAEDIKKNNGKLVLGLATGMTMEPVYEELVRLHREDGLSFKNVVFFNLDNYIFDKEIEAYKDADKFGGLPKNRNSYAFQLRDTFLDRTDALKKNIHLVGDEGFNPKAYEKQIAAAGGIDIQLVGLGGEGHIGFNEVGSSIDSPFRKVKLAMRTRRDNSHFFDQPGEEMPTHAYTRGVGDILKAKKIIALANGESKAWAIRNMMDISGKADQDNTSLESKRKQQFKESHGLIPKNAKKNFELFENMGYFISEKFVKNFIIEGGKIVKGRGTNARLAQAIKELPARALHAHGNVHMLVDEKAASRVRATDLVQQSTLRNDEKVKALIDKFTPQEVTLRINGQDRAVLLPPGFDFYDPKKMRLNERFDPTSTTHLRLLGNVLSKTTDTFTGAHQDDAEIMAGPMILKAQRTKGKQWLNIVVTDGASLKNKLDFRNAAQIRDPRNAKKPMSLEELVEIRRREQRRAAQKAETPVIQLCYPSVTAMGHAGEGKKEEIANVLGTLFAAMPNMENAYGHNPMDKNLTHIGVFACWAAALRANAQNKKKLTVYGLECWRGFNSYPDKMLKKFEVETTKDLHTIEKWVEPFQSQIVFQKRRYSEATAAMLVHNAAFCTAYHASNPPAGMALGIDMTRYIMKERLWEPKDIVDDFMKKSMKLVKALAAEFTSPFALDMSRGTNGLWKERVINKVPHVHHR